MKKSLLILLVFVCVSDHGWLNCDQIPETGNTAFSVSQALDRITMCGGRGQRVAKLLSMDEMAENTARRTDKEITELQEIDLLKDRMTVLEDKLFLEKGKRNLK